MLTLRTGAHIVADIVMDYKMLPENPFAYSAVSILKGGLWRQVWMEKMLPGRLKGRCSESAWPVSPELKTRRRMVFAV